jgi:hypothetical protein
MNVSTQNSPFNRPPISHKKLPLADQETIKRKGVEASGEDSPQHVRPRVLLQTATFRNRRMKHRNTKSTPHLYRGPEMRSKKSQRIDKKVLGNLRSIASTIGRSVALDFVRRTKKRGRQVIRMEIPFPRKIFSNRYNHESGSLRSIFNRSAKSQIYR